MNIPSRVIQKLWDKANAADGDVVRWTDLLAVLDELKISQTTDLTAKPVKFSDLPMYDSEDAAETGGLVIGQLYRTSTGEVRYKLVAHP